MSTSFGRLYQRAILDSPWITLAGLLILIIFFSWHAQYFRIDASADSLLLEEDEDLQTFRILEERYGGADILAITITPYDDLFSRQVLRRIQQLRDRLDDIPSIDSIMSILDVPLLQNNNTQMYLSTITKHAVKLEDPTSDPIKARKELRNSPIFSELLISKDARTTALLLTMKGDGAFRSLQHQRNRLLIKRRLEKLTAEEATALKELKEEYAIHAEKLKYQRQNDIEQIRQVMVQYRDLGTLYLGGVPMIANDMIRFIRNDLVIFGTGVLVFLIIVLYFLFRAVHWVLLPLLCCVYAGLTMIGVLGLFGWKVTVISSNFLALMLIITISMNIHLAVRYRQLGAHQGNESLRTLVLKTLERMVWPCLYAALTTIIGFGSLVFSGIKPVIDFGWMMSIGLAVTFITSFTLFPVGLLLLGVRPERHRSESGFRFNEFLARITLRHRVTIIVAAVLALIVGIFGATRLNVENSFVNYFGKNTELFRGLSLIDRELGGTTTLEILLDLNEERIFANPNDPPDDEEEDLEFAESFEEKAAYWFTDFKIKRIGEVHDYLDAIPEVGKVLSLVSLLRAGEVLNGGRPFDSLQLALIYQRISPEIKKSLIDPYAHIPHDQARILLRIRDSDPNLRRHELIQRIRTGLHDDLQLSDADFEVSGLLVLYSNMLQSLYQSQLQTLGSVLLGVSLMLFFLFRSIRLAIIGIIPNILAAVIVLGFMGLTGIPLDFMTITVAAISIGISVDNSIHYIYRFREEFASSGVYADTLQICHSYVGKAVFYTSTTIIFGFAILMLSNFNPTIYFGALIGFAITTALLGTLTLLPLLILIVKPFGPDNNRIHPPSSYFAPLSQG